LFIFLCFINYVNAEDTIDRLKIISQNIHGAFFAKLFEINDFLIKENPDILCLQETKLCQEEEYLYVDKFPGYKIYFNSIPKSKMKKRYVNSKIKKLEKKFKDSDSLFILTEQIEQLKFNIENNFKKSIKNGGIAILLKEDIAKMINEEDIYRQENEHRLLRIYIPINNNSKNVLVINNVYAPASGQTYNNPFFEELVDIYKNLDSDYLSKYKNKNVKLYVFHCGDNNAVIDSILDKSSEKVNCNGTHSCYSKFNEFIVKRDLQDSFRLLNKNLRDFTFIKYRKTVSNNNSNIDPIIKQTRIDHILTPKKWKNHILQSSILDSVITSDHRPVMLLMSINSDIVKNKPEKRPFFPRWKTRDFSLEDLKELLQHIPTNQDIIQKGEVLLQKCKHLMFLYDNKQLYKEQIVHTKKILQNMIDEFTNEFNQQLCHELNFVLKRTKNNYNRGNNGEFIKKKEIKKWKEKKRKIEAVMRYISKTLNEQVDVITDVEFQMAKRCIFHTYNSLQYKDNLEQTDLKTIINNNDIKILIQGRKELSNKIKNKINYMKRKNIKERILKIIEMAETDPRKFNRNIKRLTNTNISQPIILNKKTNKLIYSAKQKLRYGRSFYKNIYKYKSNQPGDFSPLLNLHPHTCYDQSLFNEPTMDEMDVVLKTVKKFTAPGEDSIPMEILYALPYAQKKLLFILLFVCFKSKYIPKLWKKSLITLIPKSGDLKDLNNQRPISLLSCQYKIYTQLIYRRLQKYMENYNLLENLQCGFRSNTSASEAIKALIAILEDSRQYKKEIHLLYLDIKKAFDSVQHWAIQETLTFYGIPKHFRKIINSLYKDIYAQIIFPFGITDNFNLEAGVRQGDPLSPLLFIIFLNPLLTILKNTNKGYKLNNSNLVIPMLAYADDTVLCSNNRQHFDELLNITVSYFSYFKMQFNADKSAYSYKSYENKKYTICRINNQRPKFLKSKQSYKYLGIHINIDLIWKKQTEYIDERYRKGMQAIECRRLPCTLKVQAYNTLIQPILNYSMNVIHYDNKILQNWDSLVLKTIKHAIPMRQSTSNGFVVADKELGGRKISLPSIMQISTLANSILNQSLNKQVESLSSLTLNNRILNSDYLEKNNECMLNTRLTKPRFHNKKEDLITSLVKDINNLGYSLHNSIKDINSINYYREVNGIGDHAIGKRTIDLLMRNGVKFVSQIIDKQGNLLEKSILYESFPKLQYKLGPFPYHIMQKIIDEYKTLFQKLHCTTFKIGSFRNPIQQIDVSKDINDMFYFVNWKGQKEIWCWTDGSFQKRFNKIYSGYGVFFKLNSELNFAHSSDFIQDNSFNELKAILFALLQTPTKINGEAINMRIFTDSVSSIESIQNFNNWNNKKIYTCINKEILRNIIAIIKCRLLDNSNVKFVHVPSHTNDEENGNKNLFSVQKREILEHKRNRLLVIKQEYNHFLNDIIEGNKHADALAKLGALSYPFRPIKVPGFVDKYYVTDQKGMYVTGSIHKNIEQFMRNKITEQWLQEQNILNNKQIHSKISNFFYNVNPDKDVKIRLLQEKKKDFLTKQRAKALATRGEISCKGKKRKRDFKYKSPTCLFCYDLYESSKHFIEQCSKWEDYRQKIVDFYNTLLNEYSNGKIIKLEPYFHTDKKHVTLFSSQDSLTVSQNKFVKQILLFDKHLGSKGYFPKAVFSLLKSFFIQNSKYDNGNPKPLPLDICKSILDFQITTYNEMYKERNKLFHKFDRKDFVRADDYFNDVMNLQETKITQGIHLNNNNNNNFNNDLEIGESVHDINTQVDPLTINTNIPNKKPKFKEQPLDIDPLINEQHFAPISTSHKNKRKTFFAGEDDEPELQLKRRKRKKKTKEHKKKVKHEEIGRKRKRKEEEEEKENEEEEEEEDRIISNVVTYNTLIDMYNKQNNMEKAHQLLGEMKQARITPDVVTYNTLIKMYSKQDSMEKVQQMLGEMKQARINPNVVTYNTLIEMYSKQNSMEKAHQLLREMKQAGINPDVVTYNTLIKMYSKQNDMEKAHQLLREMKQARIIPNAVTYSTLIDIYSKQNNMEKAHQMLGEMKQAGINPSVVTYNTLIDMYVKHDDMEKAHQMLGEMKQARITPDIVTYNILIEMYSKQDSMEKVHQLLREMKQAGINPDVVTYNTLIDMFAKHEDMEKLQQMLGEMKQIGLCF
jgi:pentatricopeptide repeat protein